MTIASRRVVVVLDPDHGERLRDIWPKSAAWVIGSPANHPVICLIGTGASSSNDVPLLTEAKFTGADPEHAFLDDLYMIDLHHGPHSSTEPYTSLEAIGVPLTSGIRAALIEYGFTDFSDRENGFVAERSDDESKRLR